VPHWCVCMCVCVLVRESLEMRESYLSLPVPLHSAGICSSWSSQTASLRGSRNCSCSRSSRSRSKDSSTSLYPHIPCHSPHHICRSCKMYPNSPCCSCSRRRSSRKMLERGILSSPALEVGLSTLACCKLGEPTYDHCRGPTITFAALA